MGFTTYLVYGFHILKRKTEGNFIESKEKKNEFMYFLQYADQVAIAKLSQGVNIGSERQYDTLVRQEFLIVFVSGGEA